MQRGFDKGAKPPIANPFAPAGGVKKKQNTGRQKFKGKAFSLSLPTLPPLPPSYSAPTLPPLPSLYSAITLLPLYSNSSLSTQFLPLPHLPPSQSSPSHTSQFPLSHPFPPIPSPFLPYIPIPLNKKEQPFPSSFRKRTRKQLLSSLHFLCTALYFAALRFATSYCSLLRFGSQFFATSHCSAFCCSSLRSSVLYSIGSVLLFTSAVLHSTVLNHSAQLFITLLFTALFFLASAAC